MATVNLRNHILGLNTGAKQKPDTRILTEAYENITHNKSKSFIHSTMVVEFGEGEAPERWMTFAYANKFHHDVTKKLLEVSNSENNRTKDSIQTKGIGMSHVLHKYAEKVEILSLQDTDTVEFFDEFKLQEHIEKLTKNEEVDVDKSFAENCTHTPKIRYNKFIKSHWEVDQIVKSLKTEISSYNCENEDHLDIPCGYIFMKLNRDYTVMSFEELDAILEELRLVCGIKYVNKLEKNPYIIHKDFGNFKQFKKIDKSDVLFHKDCFDKFKWNVKTVNGTTIVYFNNYCYKYSDDKLIQIKEGDDLHSTVDADWTYEYYNIGPTNLGKMGAMDGSIETFMGFYYMLDGIILNHKPQITDVILGSACRNVPGTSSVRHLVTIHNKECMDINGVKSDFSLSDVKKITLIRYLYKLMNTVNNSKWRTDKQYSFTKKTIDEKLVLEYLDTKQQKKETNKDKVVTVTPKPKTDIYKLYCNLYKIAEDNKDYDHDDGYLFKLGHTKQKIGKRTGENNKKINLPLVSQSYFTCPTSISAKNSEEQILGYLRKGDTFKNIIAKSNETERFYCTMGTFSEFESRFNKFKYALMNRTVEDWNSFIKSIHDN